MTLRDMSKNFCFAAVYLSTFLHIALSKGSYGSAESKRQLSLLLLCPTPAFDKIGLVISVPYLSDASIFISFEKTSVESVTAENLTISD